MLRFIRLALILNISLCLAGARADHLEIGSSAWLNENLREDYTFYKPLGHKPDLRQFDDCYKLYPDHWPIVNRLVFQADQVTDKERDQLVTKIVTDIGKTEQPPGDYYSTEKIEKRERKNERRREDGEIPFGEERFQDDYLADTKACLNAIPVGTNEARRKNLSKLAEELQKIDAKTTKSGANVQTIPRPNTSAR